MYTSSLELGGQQVAHYLHLVEHAVVIQSFSATALDASSKSPLHEQDVETVVSSYTCAQQQSTTL